MLCQGCGLEFPSNFLKTVDRQVYQGRVPTIQTYFFCNDCRAKLRDAGLI